MLVSCATIGMLHNRKSASIYRYPMSDIIKFENNIRLQHLVFGYKIFDKEYFHLNYFLKKITRTILFHFLLNLSFLYQFFLLKSIYFTSFLKTN